jgi:hypothetical protein
VICVEFFKASFNQAINIHKKTKYHRLFVFIVSAYNVELFAKRSVVRYFVGLKYFFAAFCNPEINIFIIFRLLIAFNKILLQQFFAYFAYCPPGHAHLDGNLGHIGVVEGAYPVDAMNLCNVQLIKKIFISVLEGVGMRPRRAKNTRKKS